MLWGVEYEPMKENYVDEVEKRGVYWGDKVLDVLTDTSRNQKEVRARSVGGASRTDHCWFHPNCRVLQGGRDRGAVAQ